MWRPGAQSGGVQMRGQGLTQAYVKKMTTIVIALALLTALANRVPGAAAKWITTALAVGLLGLSGWGLIFSLRIREAEAGPPWNDKTVPISRRARSHGGPGDSSGRPSTPSRSRSA